MSASAVGTPLHKFPEPALDHAIIPKERYTSQEFARLEWDPDVDTDLALRRAALRSGAGR